MLEPGDTVEVYRRDEETGLQKFVRKAEFLAHSFDSVPIDGQYVPYTCAIVQLENGMIRSVPIELIRIID